jgi:polyphosphate kinase
MAKKEFNTTNIGDNIVLIQMKDNISRVPLGTKGVIKRIVEDPFDKGQYIVSVDWENGSTLNLLTSEDIWFKEVDDISESIDELKTKLIDNDVDVKKLDNLINQLSDDDVTDLFLRNIDRKLLKSGDKVENLKKYFDKYIKSLEQRKNITQDPTDDFEIEDEFLYGGLEPEKSKIGRKQYKKELLPLQVELLKLQEHVKKTGKPLVVVFEGRDSAGKGSTIASMTQYLDPKYYKIIALGIPTPEERKNWFERYEKEIESGKINFFDRSWYNRGIVEPVMGYGTEEEYKDFMNTVNDFEKSLIDKGIELFKFWLSITPDTQQKRFELRKQSPLKYWKFSPNDEKSIEKWDEYTKYKNKVLKQAKEAKPWTIVDTNDKRAGTLNLLRHLLKNVDYEGKDETNIGMEFPEVVTTIKEKQISESVFDKWDRLKTILKKSEIIKIKDFIHALRDSGTINMFEAVPFIWSGGDYLENYIRFKGLDIENIEELKDMADESKNAIIRMVLSHLEKEGEEYDLDKINKTVKNFSRLAFQYYMETF